MSVVVAVEVRKPDPGGTGTLDLRRAFRGHFARDDMTLQCSSEQRGRLQEVATLVRETWRARERTTRGQGEVKPDAQPVAGGTRTARRLLERWRPDHDRGRAQRARVKRVQDAARDALRQPEIVRVDDESYVVSRNDRGAR